MSCSHEDHSGEWCPDRTVSQRGYIVTRLQRDHGLEWRQANAAVMSYYNTENHPYCSPHANEPGRQTHRIMTWDHLTGVS